MGTLHLKRLTILGIFPVWRSMPGKPSPAAYCIVLCETALVKIFHAVRGSSELPTQPIEPEAPNLWHHISFLRASLTDGHGRAHTLLAGFLRNVTLPCRASRSFLQLATHVYSDVNKSRLSESSQALGQNILGPQLASHRYWARQGLVSF